MFGNAIGGKCPAANFTLKVNKRLKLAISSYSQNIMLENDYKRHLPLLRRYLWEEDSYQHETIFVLGFYED